MAQAAKPSSKSLTERADEVDGDGREFRLRGPFGLESEDVIGDGYTGIGDYVVNATRGGECGGGIEERELGRPGCDVRLEESGTAPSWSVVR